MIDRDPTAFADIHSHLVPGVDDGAQTLDETLRGVERMTFEGIRKIITTPHLNGSLTREPDQLEARLSEVTAAFDLAADAVGKKFPEVDFRRGHEVMLDVPDVDFSDPRMRLGGSHFVLIEWPRLQVPPETVPALGRITSQGYQPIIAHPERYAGFNLTLAEQWRGAGAYLQVNYGSLEGRYGAEAKTFAMRLLRRGWVHYLSSDFHASPDRKIYRREVGEHLGALGGQEALVFMSLTNTARVFRDEEPMDVPLLPVERGFWAKVKGALNTERR